jgi:hypothetical protein
MKEADADKPVTVEQLAEIASQRMRNLNWYQKKRLLATIRVFAISTGVRGDELRDMMSQIKRLMK